jgi:hypothetical protein
LLSLLALLCLIFLLLLPSVSALKRRSLAGARPPTQQRVLPLDPLTPEERSLAASVANGDAAVRRALGAGRNRLISVEFVTPKPPESAEPQTGPSPVVPPLARQAEVVFYRYEDDQGVRALVDLERRAVIDVSPIEGRSVPLAVEEVDEAFTHASQNSEVRGLLGPRASQYRVARGPWRGDDQELRVEALRVVATSPTDPCYRHRCLVLIFRQGRYYVSGTDVTVDLTSRAVRVRRRAR